MPVNLFWSEQRYREESAALIALSGRLSNDVLLVGVDLGSPADGTAAIISAKRIGKLVVIYAVTDDPMEQLAAQIALSIGEHPDREQRYVQMHALRDGRLHVNQRPPSENVTTSPIVKNSARLLLNLADVVVATSIGEVRRLSDLLGKPIRRFALLPLEKHSSPVRFDPGITVYAPNTLRRMLRHVEMALEDRRLEAEWITAENRDAAVKTKVIVAPEWWRPLQAATLGARGHTVVAPAHGAEERTCAIPYRTLDFLGIGFAAEAALSARPYMRASGSFDDFSAALDAVRAPAIDGPQVSVIVRTFNRPALLKRALQSIAQQTYPNVEIVVVNNGGVDVRECVESAVGDRSFQYIDNPSGGHISLAANLAARAAQGEYIAYLDDDDLLYPDHLSRTVSALQETGADLAFCDSIAEYAEIEGDVKRVLGFQLYLDREFDRDEIFAQNFAPIHSIVHRKSLFERFGYFDESLPVTDDWEMWLRASQESKFVHVDRPTVEYSWRFDAARGNMTMTHQQHFVDAYVRIRERYAHRIVGRTLLPQLQAQSLAHQEHRVAILREQPERVREVMLGAQLAAAVPVGPMLEPGE